MRYYYWKVRLYRLDGMYCQCQVRTEPNTTDIDLLQDFYFRLTGAKMVLEGMSEEEGTIMSLGQAFQMLLGDA